MSKEVLTYGEVLQEVHDKILESFQNLFESALEYWNGIKQFIVGTQEKIGERNSIRDSWVVPLRIMRTNQVLNRKPVVCRARSYC